MNGHAPMDATAAEPFLATRLARGEADLLAAQRLRYEVFVAELGGDGPLVDHARRLERDAFDADCEHLVLVDARRPAGEHVVGAYRLMRAPGRQGRHYSEGEYDLGPLIRSGRPLLELGRSCVHPAYRGGMGLVHLWRGLAAYVERHGVEVLFGVASFHGTDVAALAAPLSLLHHRYLAPEGLRVRSREFQRMDLMPEAAIDRVAAMRAVPALIKAYLRAGGCVGEGAYVDRAFNTVDVCLVMEAARLGGRQAALYRPAFA